MVNQRTASETVTVTSLGPAKFPERALQVNQVSISETFGPFLGVNMRLKNQASLQVRCEAKSPTQPEPCSTIK
jgi:hypothetical protein